MKYVWHVRKAKALCKVSRNTRFSTLLHLLSPSLPSPLLSFSSLPSVFVLHTTSLITSLSCPFSIPLTLSPSFVSPSPQLIPPHPHSPYRPRPSLLFSSSLFTSLIVHLHPLISPSCPSMFAFALSHSLPSPLPFSHILPFLPVILH